MYLSILYCSPFCTICASCICASCTIRFSAAVLVYLIPLHRVVILWYRFIRIYMLLPVVGLSVTLYGHWQKSGRQTIIFLRITYQKKKRAAYIRLLLSHALYKIRLPWVISAISSGLMSVSLPGISYFGIYDQCVRILISLALIL